VQLCGASSVQTTRYASLFLKLAVPRVDSEDVTALPEGAPAPPHAPASAAEIAAAANASDMFVFRRVAERRFAHIGGVGRGMGWAGIVEIGVETEPLVESVLGSAGVLHRVQSEPWRVIGPYYANAVAVVPVTEDVFVVFGSATDDIAAVSDDQLVELARFASEALLEVTPAKKLADELEALTAVQDLLNAPVDTFDDGLQRLVDHARVALSCDLGIAYVHDREGERVAISDERGCTPLTPACVNEALGEIASYETFPLCIQDAETSELPAPFSSGDGVLAYYLLRITKPLPGLLLLMHTSSAPARGFTLLCQELGRRLVEAAEPLLGAALLRDSMREELSRVTAEARRDPLTGLANRLAWAERLAEAATSTEATTSILQLDCRGLKRINDTFGHAVGDELLRRVASVLVANVRPGDLVARLGGDEFGILLADADESRARTTATRIESALAEAAVPGQPNPELAVGVATTRDNDLEETHRRADAEMLDAKRRPSIRPALSE
jgi:diguanylate cyclase (GGDEF)-like protein